jgi:cytidine deaminase
MKYLEPDLVALARKLAEARYVEGKHQMFSALKTRAGQVYMGAHVEGGNGRVSLCAEAVAIGAAATAGDTDIDSIVVVTESGDIVAPCGMCRELISDYAPRARVLVDYKGVAIKKSIADLLPAKYQSADYPNKRKGEAAAKAAAAKSAKAGSTPKTAAGKAGDAADSQFKGPQLNVVAVPEAATHRTWVGSIRFWVWLTVFLYVLCVTGLAKLKGATPGFDISMRAMFGGPAIAFVSLWVMALIAGSLSRSRPRANEG